jgi:hypothetical protein
VGLRHGNFVLTELIAKLSLFVAPAKAGATNGLNGWFMDIELRFPAFAEMTHKEFCNRLKSLSLTCMTASIMSSEDDKT